MKIPDPFTLSPLAPGLADQIGALPESAGIYALSVPGHAPHLSWSINLKRRVKRLLVPSNADSRNLLRDRVHSVNLWLTGSRLEISLIMYELARKYNPSGYLNQLRLRLPWFVTVVNASQFPRLEVRNRLSRSSPAAFGPFLTRDLAQRYEQEVLGLFQMRRCTEVLHPHPAHPGCIYGEMSQCLRPCQSAVTHEEYAAESARVLEFLGSNGQSASTSLVVARQKASADMDFELAAQAHKRLERINAAASSRGRVITSVDEFNGVALTPAYGYRHYYLWPVVAGYWQEPVSVDLSSLESRPQSLDHELRESLESSLRTVNAEGRRAEHFALFARWYYSSWRDGQWFPFHTLQDLNYRKLVRELSKLATAG